jgi:hypothetical protein
LWPVTPASHFPQPESASAQKTLATSGHTSPDQYELFDLDYASLKMSKATSPSDSERSLESWNKLVIQRRGEYSARLKSAHRIKESGSLSWPTVTANEDSYRIGGESQQSKCLSAMARRGEMDENWSTPNCTDGKTGSTTTQGRSLVADIQLHGQAAPANPSTDGSRQGLWPTITAHTPDMESSGPNGNSGTYLAGAVKSWATPRVGGEEKAETRLARGKDIGLHGQVGAMNNTAKLNPRWVETLMGLPVGWVMPSCASPVTIEQTNFDSSATESCLPPPSELFAF